ncbi:MAG: hypothetical protein QXT69_02550 [Fervidicoccaceae archaeon]
MSSYARKGLRLLRYPFLIDDIMDYLKKRNYLPSSVNIAEAVSLLGAGSRTKEIVEDSIKFNHYRIEDEETKLPMEALAFHVALLLMVRIGGKWLANRLAVSVSKAYRGELQQLDRRELEILAELLGIKSKYHEYAESVKLKSKILRGSFVEQSFPISLSYTEYLRAAHRLMGDARWKLSNQMLVGGKVYLDRRRFERILEERIAEKISYIAEKYLELTKVPELPSPLREIESSLKESLGKIIESKEKSSLNNVGKLPISYESFPPCIKKIYERATSGENLSHAERFSLATFMLSLGVNEEALLEIFKHSPDYNEKIARYQVEHLMGKRGSKTKYKPYSCAKMRTLSLCVADCGTKTPMQKYYINLKGGRKSIENKGSPV